MRILAISLVAGLVLSGCAVRVAPVAASPMRAATATNAQPVLVASAGAPSDAAPQDEPTSQVDRVDRVDGDTADDGAEPLDSSACLDRGPSRPPHCPEFAWKSPLDTLSRAQIEKRVKTNLPSIGTVSLGVPNGGLLVNGERMPDGERWTLTDPRNAYGTEETIASITRAIDKVFRKFPESPNVIIGHISKKGGGKLGSHLSHQAGRDVDLSFFYKTKIRSFAHATSDNLDLDRTWVFVRAFVEDPNTEMVLMDSAVQRTLYDFAKEHGETTEFLDRVFQVSGKNPGSIIRHARGHDTHIHVRFFSPSAQTSGRLAQAWLPKPAPPSRRRNPGKHRGPLADAPSLARADGEANGGSFLLHRARSGDTLDLLAKRYGVSIAAIKQANGMHGDELKQKHTYRIPTSSRTAATVSPRAGAGGGRRAR